MMLSIIVPVYNSEEYLDDCIKSILNQSFSDFELILVNDGSVDNSLNICNYWKSVDSRIKVISHENCGVGKTRNKGIELADGKYIGFVDSDDYIDCTMYEELIRITEINEADIGICELCIPGKKQNYGYFYPIEERFIFDSGHCYWKEKLFQGNSETFVTNKIFRKQFLNLHEIEFTDYPIFEDRLFMMNCYLYNPSMIFIDKQLYYYRTVYNSAIRRYCDKRLEIVHEIYLYNLLLNKKFENFYYSKIIEKSFAESLVNCIKQETINKPEFRLLKLKNIREIQEFEHVYNNIDSLSIKGLDNRILRWMYDENWKMLLVYLKISACYMSLKQYIKIMGK